MMKLRSKILAGMSTIAVAGVVAAAGVTSADASPTAGAARSGFEYFQLVKTSSANSAPETIIGRGVFTAGGSAADTSSTTATVTFPSGTFVITHSKGTGTPRFNPTTCLFTLALNGTYQLGHGTGTYAKISGHGIYRLNITAVAARNSVGKCTNKLTAYQQITRAQGPAHL